MSDQNAATKIALHCLDKQGPIASLVDLNLPVQWDAKKNDVSLFELTCIRLEEHMDKSALPALWDQYVSYRGMSAPARVESFLLSSPTPIHLMEFKAFGLLDEWSKLPCWPQLQERLATHPAVLNCCLDHSWWNKASRNTLIKSFPELFQAWKTHHASSVWLMSINSSELDRRFAEYKSTVGQPNVWTSEDAQRWCKKSLDLFNKELSSNPHTQRARSCTWRWKVLFGPSASPAMDNQLWEQFLLSDQLPASLLSDVVMETKWDHPWNTILPFDQMSTNAMSGILEHLHNRHQQSREQLVAFQKTLVECFRSAVLKKITTNPKNKDLFNVSSQCDVLLEKAPAKIDDRVIPVVEHMLQNKTLPWRPDMHVLNSDFAYQAYGRRVAMSITSMTDEHLTNHWRDIIQSTQQLHESPRAMYVYRSLAHASWVRLQKTADPALRAMVCQMLWTGVLLSADKDQKSFLTRFASVEQQMQFNPRLNPYFVPLDQELMDEVLKKFKMSLKTKDNDKVKFERVLLRQFTTASHDRASTAKRKM